MPNKALVFVAAAVLEVREKPSTYSSRRPGRQVPTIVDQVDSSKSRLDDLPLVWANCPRLIRGGWPRLSLEDFADGLVGI